MLLNKLRLGTLFKTVSRNQLNFARNVQNFNFYAFSSQNYLQAEEYFKKKEYTKALDTLYKLEQEVQDLDIERLKVLNLLAQTELEQGNVDQAKLFNEEAMNIYHINNQQTANVEKNNEYFQNLLQYARTFTVRTNVLGKNQDDSLIIPLLQQSKGVYQECYENIEQYKESTKDQNIIRQELALTLTKQSLKQIQQQKFDECVQNIEEALSIWKEVENYQTLNSYKYTYLVYGMAQIMKKNYDVGVKVLSEIRDGIDESTFKNYNMANLYMGSLCVLTHVYKVRDQAKYKQIINDFDRALELLGQNPEKNAQQLFQQYKAFNNAKM